MKKIVLTTMTCFIALISLQSTYAQSKKSEETILKMWDEVWTAYEKGDEMAMWNAYSPNATEIYPDGSIISGKDNLKKGYDEFKTMLEGKPSWKYTKPTVRLIDPTTALLYADINSDIKLKGGQQVGGKMKFATILHQVNGKWLIEFTSQTPVMQMPVEGGK